MGITVSQVFISNNIFDNMAVFLELCDIIMVSRINKLYNSIVKNINHPVRDDWSKINQNYWCNLGEIIFLQLRGFGALKMPYNNFMYYEIKCGDYTQNEFSKLTSDVSCLISNTQQKMDFELSVAYLFGNGKYAKYLIKKYKLDIRINGDVLIKHACACGKLSFVKIFINRCKQTNNFINICEFRKFLIFAVGSGNIDLLEYLLSIAPDYSDFDIHFDNEYLLLWAVTRDNVQMIKYLLSLENRFGAFDLHANDDRLIIDAFEIRNITTIDFLLSLENKHGKFNLNAQDNLIFINAAQYEIEGICQLLVRLSKTTHTHIDFVRIKTSLDEYGLDMSSFPLILQ